MGGKYKEKLAAPNVGTREPIPQPASRHAAYSMITQKEKPAIIIAGLAFRFLEVCATECYSSALILVGHAKAWAADLAAVRARWLLLARATPF